MRNLDGNLILEFIMNRKQIDKKEIAKSYLLVAPSQLSKKPLRVNPSDWYDKLFDLGKEESALHGQAESEVIGALKLFIESNCDNALEGVNIETYENFVKEVLLRACMRSSATSLSVKEKTLGSGKIATLLVPTPVKTQSEKLADETSSDDDIFAALSTAPWNSDYSDDDITDFPFGEEAYQLREVFKDAVLGHRIDVLLDQHGTEEFDCDDLSDDIEAYFKRMKTVLNNHPIAFRLNLKEKRMCDDISAFNRYLSEYIDAIPLRPFSAFQAFDRVSDDDLYRKIIYTLKKIWSYGVDDEADNNSRAATEKGRDINTLT